jgi:hypothetical protein
MLTCVVMRYDTSYEFKCSCGVVDKSSAKRTVIKGHELKMFVSCHDGFSGDWKSMGESSKVGRRGLLFTSVVDSKKSRRFSR